MLHQSRTRLATIISMVSFWNYKDFLTLFLFGLQLWNHVKIYIDCNLQNCEFDKESINMRNPASERKIMK